MLFTLLATNCACSNANYVIEEKVDAAKHISLYQEQQANDKPNEGPIGSIIKHLGYFLNILLSAALTGYLDVVSSLPEGVASALKGLSENGLFGLLGGLARSLSSTLEKTSANAAISGLSGEKNNILPQRA